MNSIQFNKLIKFSKRLRQHARYLKMSYDCSVVLLEYSKAETRLEDRQEHTYPERIDLNIENWSTWKGSFRLSDGRFIREGTDLNGPGLSMFSLCRRMIRELEAHAERIKLYEEARATNSIVFNGSPVVVENADAEAWYSRRDVIFELYAADGTCSRWYGPNAETALNNSYPWTKNNPPVLMRVSEDSVDMIQEESKHA